MLALRYAVRVGAHCFPKLRGRRDGQPAAPSPHPSAGRRIDARRNDELVVIRPRPATPGIDLINDLLALGLAQDEVVFETHQS